jgi:hypothetical protein
MQNSTKKSSLVPPQHENRNISQSQSPAGYNSLNNTWEEEKTSKYEYHGLTSGRNKINNANNASMMSEGGVASMDISSYSTQQRRDTSSIFGSATAVSEGQGGPGLIFGRPLAKVYIHACIHIHIHRHSTVLVLTCWVNLLSILILFMDVWFWRDCDMCV